MITHLVSIISSALFMAIGGRSFLFARRELLPLMLCADAHYVTKSVWAFTMLVACGTLSLGYGERSPLRRLFGDGLGRGIWSLFVGISLCAWAVPTGHLPLLIALLYCIACFIAEPLFKNLPQFIGDMLIGSVFGSIVFFFK